MNVRDGWRPAKSRNALAVARRILRRIPSLDTIPCFLITLLVLASPARHKDQVGRKLSTHLISFQYFQCIVPNRITVGRIGQTFDYT